jgi:hypothetical protein
MLIDVLNRLLDSAFNLISYWQDRVNLLRLSFCYVKVIMVVAKVVLFLINCILQAIYAYLLFLFDNVVTWYKNRSP